MKLQTGSDDFGKIRTKGLDFVDKTLFVKEILDMDNVEVSVITRPRRFGKTFNLSMLHHFLASEVNRIKTAGLFDGLKISEVDGGSYMQHQGKYPVIFISFKNIKSETIDLAYDKLYELIIETFNEHGYLKHSDKLNSNEKSRFRNILDKKANRAEIEGSLNFLTSVLSKHYEAKSWLLIDEYDTPIQSGYIHDYYDEIIELMRGMMGSALKSNPYLDRSIITGVLRVAKESLFSGLNNVRVFSLLSTQYSKHFGFTEAEVEELLEKADLNNKKDDVKKWYNGYVFGNTVVYNPWSIVNYINDPVLTAYWTNTSDNILIKDLLIKSTGEFKKQFKLLLQDETVEKIIDEHVVFGDLKNNIHSIWSLLLMSGYLKATSTTLDMGNTICKLAIPNLEVKILYVNIIKTWLGNGNGIMWYQNFLSHLLTGDIESFKEEFGQVLLQTISVHDPAHNPEAFYHGFMLGLAAGIDQKQYETKSNRESGLGRYDIAIIPKDLKKAAVILEIKSLSQPKGAKKTMDEDELDILLAAEAKKALEQIDKNQYITELTQRGITDIIKIGLSFFGREFRCVSKKSG